MSATSILINIGAQTAQAVTEINKVNSALGEHATKAEKVKGSIQRAAAPAAAAFAAIGGAALLSVKGAEEAEIANRKLSQVFEQMGYGDLAAEAAKYADELEKTTGIEAEVIKAAQTKLATFTDVAASADLMARATKASADLSAAGFGEMSSVSNGLGKALQDPIAGMALLTKQGSLTKDEQKKIADAFAKTGDKAAAQDAILSALEKQVGGVAEASATNSDKMRNAFGSISDAVGLALLPAFEKLTPLVQGFADWASNNSGVILVIGGVIGGLAGIILALNLAMTIWTAVTTAWAVATTIATAVGTAFGAVIAFITSPIFLIIAAIVALIAIGVLLYKNWDTIKEFLSTAWEAIKTKAVEVWNAVKDFFVELWDSIKTKVIEIWDSVKTWLETTWGNIKTKAVELFEGIKTAVSEKITAVITFAKELPGNVLTAIGDVAKTLFQKGVDLIQGIIDGYVSIWSTVLEFAGGIGVKVLEAIGNVGKTLYDKGKSLIQGFIDGIRSMAGKILEAIIGILPGPVRGIIRGALGFSLAPGRSANLATYGRAGRAGGATTINLYGNATAGDARTIKRALEGYDVRQGRAAGRPLAEAW